VVDGERRYARRLHACIDVPKSEGI
jgi:hypothetical protein